MTAKTHKPQRGMNMRDMKAVQMGKLQKPGRKPLTRAATEYERRPDEPDLEPVDEIENGVIAHQTDGTFVVVPRRRETPDDDGGHDCPDEEPPGWCET